jgi:hypothetical protein
MNSDPKVIACAMRSVSSTRLLISVFALGVVFFPRPTRSAEFDTGNPDLHLRWDNTVKYSAGFRLKEPSSTLLADVNLDDGDRNFDRGLITNRVDLLSEFDLSAKNFGLRVSGAAWYDSVYNRSNDNVSPFTNNAVSVRSDEFTSATRNLHGRRAEILDAFVFGKGEIGGKSGTLRFGRHTLIYGESLFFGANGIANAQGPVDLVKLLSVPGSQFKEILRPVEQISGLLQLAKNLSIGAYYQLRWRDTKIPAVGSYLSNADFVGGGAERIIVGPPIVPGGGPAAFWRATDIKAKDSGQGGVQLRFTPKNSEWEFGLYAAQYHDKTPYLYFDASNPANVNVLTGRIGLLREVFAENIKTFGASATTSVGQLNLAGEVSIRRNTPLVSDPQVVAPGVVADNDEHALYAVGNSVHAQISGIYVLTPTTFWKGGVLLGEIAWNERTSITKNPKALDPNTTKDALAARFIFEPAYYQLFPGLDLSVPIGLGYNLAGRSSVVFNFNGGSSRGGDLSLGLNFTYKTVWQWGLNYVSFLGKADGFLTPANSPTPVLSYKQSLKDRDFVSFNFKRAF